MFGLGESGGSLVLYNFMDNLVERGYEVYAVLPDRNIKWEKGIWKKLIVRPGFSLKNFLYYHLKGDVLDQPLEQFTNNLLKNWVDSEITIATYCKTAYAAYHLSEKTVPLYHMQHLEELFFDNQKDRLMARNTYFLPLIRISNSQWLKDMLQKQFNQKSQVLNPGIDLETFHPYQEPDMKFVDKKEWTVVSFVDGNREWKGFDDAVQAVKMARETLSKQGIQLNWKTYGFNPKKSDTDMEHKGLVYGDDLARLYSESDLVLLPSWYESFPLPPLEAMACGSLIITTRYGTEDYVVHGENGLVCSPRKPEQLAEQMVYAINHPERCLEMVKRGMETAHEYSWDKRTDCLEKILEESLHNYDFNKFRELENMVKGKFL
jgi:glycosyltransferase involved in cell wall biosynthesis